MAINRLHEFPYSGSIPRYSILKKQGYRVVIVERHLIFYKINELDEDELFSSIKNGSRKRNLTEYKKLYIIKSLSGNYTMKEIGNNIEISEVAVFSLANKN